MYVEAGIAMGSSRSDLPKEQRIDCASLFIPCYTAVLSQARPIDTLHRTSTVSYKVQDMYKACNPPLKSPVYCEGEQELAINSVCSLTCTNNYCA